MLSGLLTADVVGFFLVFTRIGAMLSLFPAIGDEAIPVRVRLLLALLATAVIYPTVFLHLPPTPKNLDQLFILTARELLIGLMLGTAVRIILQAIHVAGTIIANQTGFATATLFDPSMGGQSAVITRFMSLVAVTMIFASNTHHLLLMGMAQSFSLFSGTAPLMLGDFAKWSADVVAQSFALGVQLSAPFLVFGIVFNAGLGLLARLVPSVQSFFIAQPLALILSLSLLMALIGTMMMVFLSRFRSALIPMMGVG
jgi:flagellar biosynthesis protein FliR